MLRQDAVAAVNGEVMVGVKTHLLTIAKAAAPWLGRRMRAEIARVWSEARSLIRWFRRRYPTPGARLAYVRRAYRRLRTAYPPLVPPGL